MGDDRIGIGFIGAGGIARQRHIPGLKAIPGVELVAVCNHSEESSRRAAQEFGFREIETDWRALIERPDVDAVFIATWPYMHCPMSIAALEAGKHVFCQARMAMNLAEAQQMLAVAQAHPELVNMLCPPPHRMPYEPYVRTMIRTGNLGELREVEVACLDASCDNPNVISWRERIEYSGNQIMQVGIWAEVLNAWVGEYDTLKAQTYTPVPTKTDADGKPYQIRIPQVVLIEGQLRNGAIIHEHHSGVSQEPPMNSITIYGSLGRIRYPVGGKLLFGKTGEPLKPAEVPPELMCSWQVERSFITAVRAARAGAPPTQRRVSPDFAEGLKYMKKVEAVHLSAQTGQPVKLDS
ncbi:MAG: Gfo/Idh/MocA family oxidoreductase [Phycisphaeraceae bacterium]